MAHGGLAHIELSTPDLAASRRFYATILGWRFDDVPGMEGRSLFTTPDGQGGGFMSGPQAEKPSAAGPVLHLEVDNIDPALMRIAAAGGRTLQPKTKISDDFGFFAVFLDNVGNRLGLWSRT
jgi:predicted enzyme related to lactoylglutathione lyase